MSFFDIFRSKKRNFVDLIVHPTTYGERITRKQAMELPPVVSAVDFISSVVASLPVKLYKSNDANKTIREITDDPRLILLNDSSGDLITPTAIKQNIVADMLLSGAGYVYIDKLAGHPYKLIYIPADKVYVEDDTYNPLQKKVRIRLNDIGTAYYPWDFIILARHTTNGCDGKGIIQENPILLNSVYMALQMERSLNTRGGNKRGFLKSERSIDEAAFKKLKEHWEKFSNILNPESTNMMVLQNGIDFKEISATAAESQMVELKKSSTDQIASLFGLSPGVMMGKASNEEYIASIKSGVLPVVNALQSAINFSLLTEAEKRQSYYFVLDTTELLKADILSRYQAYSIGLQSNFLQPDEVRYKEDLPPLGLDFIKLGLNDVLYNPKTQKIYTPNTDSLTSIDGAGKGVSKNESQGEE